jgi:hypothetical protein
MVKGFTNSAARYSESRVVRDREIAWRAVSSRRAAMARPAKSERGAKSCSPRDGWPIRQVFGLSGRNIVGHALSPGGAGHLPLAEKENAMCALCAGIVALFASLFGGSPIGL